jgi:hypothetical protein
MVAKKQSFLRAAAVGLLLSALPAQSQACWLFDWCGHHRSQTTFYAPVATAPACSQQTVNYVPQTAYRPLVTTTPVTAMRPVVSTDPCTGCPTTIMQPATTYVQRTVMMPYTTYRPVVQTSYYAPAVAAPVVAAPACPTGACGAATSYYQPATVVPAAPVVTQPSCCTPTAAATTFAPTSATTIISNPTTPAGNGSTASPPSTFRNEPSPSDSKPQGDESNAPANTGMSSFPALPPQRVKSGTAEREDSVPRLHDPQNRTTMNRLAGDYMPVAYRASKPTVESLKINKLDDSGWSQAR